MRRPLMLLTTAALALGATGLAEAHQTTGPGANGRMIIASDRPGSVGSDIWSINPDGSDPVNLSKAMGTDVNPVISPDGTKIAFTSLRHPQSQDYDVFVMNADGTNPVNLTNSPSQDSQPAWSPDGSRIAFTSTGPGAQGFDVFVMNADGGGRTNITNHPATDMTPAWSPDGSRIAFTSGRDGNGLDVHTMAPDGSGVTNLTKRPGTDEAPVWSPTGDAIAFQSDAGDSGYTGIWLMKADGSRRSWVTRTSERGSHLSPTFSPDGRQIAYESNVLSAAGSSDVFVINTDGTGARNITHDGSPYRQSEGGGVQTNGDTPGSWAIDRSQPAPAPAPTVFPADPGDPRGTVTLDVSAKPTAGRRVKVDVTLQGANYRFNLWDAECQGAATVKVNAGRKTIVKRTVKLGKRGTLCGFVATIKVPKGKRATSVTAAFKGNDFVRPVEAKEALGG